MNSDAPFVVAITGASGVVYARRLIEFLLSSGASVRAVMSESGAQVWRQETGDVIRARAMEQELLAPSVPPSALERLVCDRYDDYFSPVASGSFLTRGMVVCPCSGQTLSAVAHSVAGNLIQRAAEVHLKERRKLILVPRETPVSLGQLENMAMAARHGAVILPAAPGWYHGVTSLDDLVDFVVARILDQLGVPNALMERWGVDR